MHYRRVQIETPVRLATMQEDGDRRNRDVCNYQGKCNDLPPRCLGQTTRNEGQDVIHKAILASRAESLSLSHLARIKQGRLKY